MLLHFFVFLIADMSFFSSMARIRLIFWNVSFLPEFTVRRIRMSLALYSCSINQDSILQTNQTRINDCRLTGYWMIRFNHVHQGNSQTRYSTSSSLHPILVAQNIKKEQLQESRSLGSSLSYIDRILDFLPQHKYYLECLDCLLFKFVYFNVLYFPGFTKTCMTYDLAALVLCFRHGQRQRQHAGAVGFSMFIRLLCNLPFFPQYLFV